MSLNRSIFRPIFRSNSGGGGTPVVPIVISAPDGAYPGAALNITGGQVVIFDVGDPLTEYDGYEDGAVAYRFYKNGVADGDFFFTVPTTIPLDFTTGDILTVRDYSGNISNALTIIAVPAITGTAYPENTLTSNYAKQWYLDGVAVAGQTGSTLVVPFTVNPGQIYTQTGSNSVAVPALNTITTGWHSNIVSDGGVINPAGYGLTPTKWYHDEFFRALVAGGVWSDVKDGAMLAFLGDTTAIKRKFKDGTSGVTPILVASGAAPTYTPTGDGLGTKGNGTTTTWASGFTIDPASTTVTILRQKYTSVGGNGGTTLSTSPATGDSRIYAGDNQGAGIVNNAPRVGLSCVVSASVVAGVEHSHTHGMSNSPLAGVSGITVTAAPVNLFGHLRFATTTYYTNIGAAIYLVSNYLSEAKQLALAKAIEKLAVRFGVPVGPEIAFLGDSITQGQGATNQYTQPWTGLVAASVGMIERNFGVPSSRVRTAGSQGAIWERRFGPGNWSPSRVCFMGGTNDATSDGTAQTADFTSKVNDIVDALIAAVGGNSRNVTIATVPYRLSTSPAGQISIGQAYSTIIRSIASAKNVRLADVEAAMIAGGGDAIMADSVHPNTAGHLVIANCFIAAQTGP